MVVSSRRVRAQHRMQRELIDPVFEIGTLFTDDDKPDIGMFDR